MATTVTDETRRSSILFGATTLLVVATTCVVTDQRGMLSEGTPTAFAGIVPDMTAETAAPGESAGIGGGTGGHHRGFAKARHRGGPDKDGSDYATGVQTPGAADGVPGTKPDIVVAYAGSPAIDIPAPATPSGNGGGGNPGDNPGIVDPLDPGNPKPPVTTGPGGTGGNPTPVSPAPEPATWALMLLGLGLVGFLGLRGRTARL